MKTNERVLTPKQEASIFTMKIDMRRNYRKAKVDVEEFMQSSYFQNTMNNRERSIFNQLIEHQHNQPSEEIDNELFSYYTIFTTIEIILSYHLEILMLTTEETKLLHRLHLMMKYDLIFHYEWTREHIRKMKKGDAL